VVAESGEQRVDLASGVPPPVSGPDCSAAAIDGLGGPMDGLAEPVH